MEETDKDPQNTTAPPVGPSGIMDVQPPKTTFNPATANPGGSNPNEEESNAAATETAPAQATTPVDGAANADTQPATVGQPATGANAASTQPSDNPMAVSQPPAPKKSGAPVAAVIVAIVIAIGLAAIVILAYLKTNKNKNAAGNSAAPATVQVTPEDVDEVSRETDAALSQIDDNKDFAGTDLADQNLNL